jgi:hypothetical protein
LGVLRATYTREGVDKEMQAQPDLDVAWDEERTKKMARREGRVECGMSYE